MPAIKSNRSRLPPSRRFPFPPNDTPRASGSFSPVAPEAGRGPKGGLPVGVLCGIVRQVTAEMLMLVGDRVQLRRDRRRSNCHVRQIAMYVSHVVLQISLTDIGQVFGRDRTTVGHACHVVEDRRDDAAFDDFVAAVERVVASALRVGGGCDHG